ARRVAVGQLLGRDTLLGRALLHLEPMLIGAGEQEDLAAVQAGKAGHDITGDGCVGMAEMRLAIGVIDRRGEVEGRSPAHEVNAPWAAPRASGASGGQN